jgi:DNA polymerase III alpha subunit
MTEDADILRRAMSGKTRSKQEFENVKNHYFENCKALGYPDQLTNEVYRQIESFAGYSFCKAHSASYAVESYQSLYLKVHYPIEFMVAVINNFGGFYRSEVYFHEAKMAGATVCNPCINNSEQLTTVIGTTIYIGFTHLQSLPQAIGEAIVTEREQNGYFKSLNDFVNRINIGIEALQTLIFIDAFRFTRKPKNELILDARMLLNKFIPINRGQRLFEEPLKEFVLPTLERSLYEDAYDEIELIGFAVSCSPFDLLQTAYRGDVFAPALDKLHGKVVKMLGYLISIKEVPTKRGMMNFGTWIDAQGNYFDTAHFAESLKRHSFQGGGCYLLLAKVDVELSFPTLQVQKMAKLPFVPDPRYADDKDMKHTIHSKIKSDISTTHRLPYPTGKEIGLPRGKMLVV